MFFLKKMTSLPEKQIKTYGSEYFVQYFYNDSDT